MSSLIGSMWHAAGPNYCIQMMGEAMTELKASVKKYLTIKNLYLDEGPCDAKGFQT